VGDLAHPELRIGDAERQACDERLKTAVGAGQLTLPEYEERVGAVWSARTAGDLAVLVRDLPSHDRPKQDLWSSPPLPAAVPPSRRRKVVGLVIAGVVGLGILNAVNGSPATTSHSKSSNVGNRIIVANETDDRVVIPSGVGNVTVVIPDSYRADVQGITGLVGNVVCEQACALQTAKVIQIVSERRTGNIIIHTRQEQGLP
jgi:hypothetical protein